MKKEVEKSSNSMKAFEIVAMCNTEQEARAKEIKLKNQGNLEVIVTKPTGDGPYGNFWLVKIPTEWPKKTNESFICSDCKKNYISITDFFVCWNCDNLECVMCASKRIFQNNNIITPKEVGYCKKCGAKWGFFNMAPTVRYMLAQQQPISETYFKMGMLGTELLDLWFLGIEVDDLTGQCEELARGLSSQSQIDFSIWYDNLKTIRNNYRRMEKSLAYMIEKHYNCLNSEQAKDLSLEDLPGPVYKRKLIYAQIINPLLSHIIELFNSEKNESSFTESILEINERVRNSESHFSIQQFHSMNELSKIKDINEKYTIKVISDLIKNVILR